MEERPQDSSYKKRIPLLAFALSLFFGGVGQIYNGQPLKGVLFIIVPFLILIIGGVTGGFKVFFGLVAVFLLVLGIKVYALVDAYTVAKRKPRHVQQSYVKWYFYVLIIAGVLLMQNLFVEFTRSKITGVASFSIPTPSGEPSLLVGDIVMVNLEAYETEEPEYGDVIAFKHFDQRLQAESVYTFRIVGLPGDVVGVQNSIVAINGKVCDAIRIGEVEMGKNPFPTLEIRETLPNQISYSIYWPANKDYQPYAYTDDLTLSDNEYYVLGDNRGNAMDSRVIGAIARDKIIGKMSYVFFSRTWEQIGRNVE